MFPFKYLFMEKPEFYYKNIMRYKPVIKDNKIDYNIKNYDNIDIFTDYFNEQERIKAKFITQEYSPFEYWEMNKEEIIKKFHKDFYEMREYIYKNVKEVSLFKITTILEIIFDLGKNPKKLKILDASAGWGDRLIAFMCLNVNEYIGFDPNKHLQEGYDEIMKTIKGFNHSENNYKIFPESFEKCEYENYFDIVFASPPFFKLEEYEKDNPEQSIIKYSNFKDWKNVFFKNYLNNCIKACKKDGLIYLYITNTKNFKIIDFINYQMKNNHVKFVKKIMVGGASNHYFPLWVWHKI